MYLVTIRLLVFLVCLAFHPQDFQGLPIAVTSATFVCSAPSSLPALMAARTLDSTTFDPSTMACTPLDVDLLTQYPNAAGQVYLVKYSAQGSSGVRVLS